MKPSKSTGSIVDCMMPTWLASGCVVSASYTICVPQPFSAILWVVAAFLFWKTCHSFVTI